MVYCTRADVENHWGKTNVAKWGDADNKGVTQDIADRITYMIAKATAYIDDRLRASIYTIPFTTTPDTIKYICAALTGIYLYQSPRGLVDGDDTNDAISNEMSKCDKQLQLILTGGLFLDATRDGSNIPAVIKEEA